MHVLRRCMSERVDLKKITIGSCKCMQLAFFFCKYICVHGYDWYIFAENRYTCPFYDEACLKELVFFYQNSNW